MSRKADVTKISFILNDDSPSSAGTSAKPAASQTPDHRDQAIGSTSPQAEPSLTSDSSYPDTPTCPPQQLPGMTPNNSLSTAITQLDKNAAVGNLRIASSEAGTEGEGPDSETMRGLGISLSTQDVAGDEETKSPGQEGTTKTVVKDYQKCVHVNEQGQRCEAEVVNMRKMITHAFGRNKRSTLDIGPMMFETRCRQHYQRSMYRMCTNPKEQSWGMMQVDSIHKVIEHIERLGAATSFHIQPRAREIARRHYANLKTPPGVKIPKPTGTKPQDPNKRKSPEIKTWPLSDAVIDKCGWNKSFRDVYDVLALLVEEHHEWDEDTKTTRLNLPCWPDLELIPNIAPTWNPETGNHTATPESRAAATAAKRQRRQEAGANKKLKTSH